jgi:hypothetical protein
MERIINMVIQQVIRQFINRGMSAGIDRLTRGKGDATPEHQADRRQNADRAKGAIRLLRRFGRF